MACFLKGEDPSGDSERPPRCPTRSFAEDGEALWAALVGDQVLILPVWFPALPSGIKTDGGENET